MTTVQAALVVAPQAAKKAWQRWRHCYQWHWCRQPVPLCRPTTAMPSKVVLNSEAAKKQDQEQRQLRQQQQEQPLPQPLLPLPLLPLLDHLLENTRKRHLPQCKRRHSPTQSIVWTSSVDA
jgi:hypothetical protein